MSIEAKEDALELIRTHLPKYLTADIKENLFSVVKENFPLSIDPSLIYQRLPDEDIYYQGDCIVDIPFSFFETRDGGTFITRFLNGIILSNTCDISLENERLEKPFIQFSNILPLNDYVEKLEEKKVASQRIESFLSNLKSNRISNLFYLPEKRNADEIIMEESFVRFDSAVSLPLSALEGEAYDRRYKPDGDRVFSFSNYGFYLFLIKLSIHYCRIREGVFRNAKS